MPSERDLWAAANTMLRQHGAAAERRCLARAADLARRGDKTGADVFRKLAQLVPELRREHGEKQDA